ncbi:hypothetical protein ELI16_14405 [Rhizobium ruizarguesonis]|uniref:hypothetical protein n=1 Tax=Rhizobium ruizarguesonis TaxID=2081791 RepID=UPI00102F43C9|nr:hypothetical protein [Rhizobium ruizarguesonis]TAW73044.1 hypothetical protein ELI16_14405 [Rhizobium ruizarguesonis]
MGWFCRKIKYWFQVELKQPDGKLIIGIEDLLPGDILLYRPSKPKWHQRKISQATDSPYTHAAIYVGNGRIAESNVVGGVKRKPINSILKGSAYVAVLRSQMGFSHDRPKRLSDFVDAVVKKRRFYDFRGAYNFAESSRGYLEVQLEFINENFGKYLAADDLAKKRFICSAFVVACYTAVGLVGDTAQVAYRDEHFSPGHLSTEPTFGWLIGYLVPLRQPLPPAEDPCHGKGVWNDIGGQWWS